MLEQKLAATAFYGVRLQADYGEWIATASQGREGDAAMISSGLSWHLEQAARLAHENGVGFAELSKLLAEVDSPSDLPY